ncbi:hypothetical protein GE09DRAFT_257032 [Coniochaeta sp. 2T2.1]|nr:hypothetical protein GE09DRAFT_257032 [Coniochaeta sp. 2T2.1]
MMAMEELRQRASQLSSSLTTEESCTKLAEYVPASFSFSEILALSSSVKAADDPRPSLLVTAACLRYLDRLKAHDDDLSVATELATWVAKSIAPINTSTQHNQEGSLPGYGGTQDDDPYDTVTKHILPLLEPGLTALTLLANHFPNDLPDLLKDDTLITLISVSDLSNLSESWSTPTTVDLASNLLTSALASLPNPNSVDIIGHYLTSYLRPLFSASRPSTVTPSGRPAAFPADELDRPQGLPDDSRLTKPWKYVDLRAIPVLSFAVLRAQRDTINWPLYVPPLLALLDDSLTRVRTRGLQITTDFLRKLPANKLRETGLARVFEDAIFPTLGYLPSLTPEEESLLLLDPAFGALLTLAEQLAASERQDPQTPSSSQKDTARILLLDKLLRHGVFTAYAHCPENSRIVALLARKTARIVSALGVRAVKHLKDVVPMLKAVMTDPFAYASVDTLVEAVGALEAVVMNCWPRLLLQDGGGGWFNEVLGMVTVAWLNGVDYLGEAKEATGKARKGKLGDEVRRKDEVERKKREVERVRVALNQVLDLLQGIARDGGEHRVDQGLDLAVEKLGETGLFKSLVPDGP